MFATTDWLDDLNDLDLAVYAAVAATPTPAFDRGLTWLAEAADYSRLWLASSVALAATGGARGRSAAVRGVASIAVTSAAVNLIVKPIARRRRPDRDAARVPSARQVSMPESRSLPSGHSAAGFAFATAVGDVLPAHAAALRGLAALVAYSRVHTGVHYPGDVVIGALLGTATAQLTVRAIRRD